MSESERSVVVMETNGTGEPDPRQVQGVDRGPPPPWAYAAATVATLALTMWMARLAVPWLAVAAAGAVAWAWVAFRSRGRYSIGGAVLLLTCVGAGIGIQTRLSEVALAWPNLRDRIEESAAAALNGRLDGLVVRGEAAAEEVERAVSGGSRARASRQLFAHLETLQREAGVSALALFDAGSRPVAWAGEHRGSVPLEVARGAQRYIFHEGPLFSYLYFVRPMRAGGVAVAAVLLEANVAVGEGEVPFAERFEETRGLRPRFSLPSRATGATVWDWSTDRPILSVTFAELTQEDWWERVAGRGRRAVGALWAAAVVLLGASWYRNRRGTPGLPVAVATTGLALAPLGEIFGTEHLFSPLQFVVPAPGDLTLGVLLVLLCGASVWLLTLDPSRFARLGLRPWQQVALAAPAFPLAVLLIQRSAAGGLLASRPAGGFPLQLAGTLLLTVVLYLVLAAGRQGRRLARARLLLSGGALAAAGSVTVGAGWEPGWENPAWLAAAWGIPFALIALAIPPRQPGSRIRLWLAAGALAASAVLPQLWVMHTEAELERAERELARLGTETDPFLDFLLRQFAERALAFAEEGEEGVNLLYHSWVASGLAREGYESRLSIWRGGRAETELRLSETDTVAAVVPNLVATLPRDDGPLVRTFTDLESLHYLLLVPLPDGAVISVAVPPRQQLGRSTALARFLQPRSEGEAAAYNQTLYLVPVTPQPTGAADSLAMRNAAVRWSRTSRGWRSEARAHFPAGWMHAHLFIRTPAPPLVMVRALLAVAALLGSLVILWLAARALCGEIAFERLLRQRWTRSFRGRLTLTLFCFFLLPTALFGAVAYTAVAREVVRSAAGRAERVLEQAAPMALHERLSAISRDVQTDLLLYRDGTQIGAAAPEVLDLGLFHSWLPPDVYLRFRSGADAEALEERELGGNDYLVAYRRLDPSTVLAAPIPLASEEITRRQREFRDIALLASLLGAALSIFLALLAGRALTRPIDELSRAAATVGAGNLRVRLPERQADEFGSVYQSFNRMVRRLRQARGALVRETRRTETIVAEAATGVLALDAAERVELVNPRASAILGAELERGAPLPRANPVLAAVIDALKEFRASGALEAGRELEIESRILRLRLRQLTATIGLRGTVIAIEDVTSEVRTARVLAWGEMARQVAHEIKNPLTPIKLAVQHLRRAYADGRADFGEILDRNVSSILEEIDRLGEIARAFSRFGTPQDTAVPLERVDVRRAIEETLALYRSGGPGLDYQLELEGDDLAATARTGELKEVLVNLLENAREALDGEGTIGIAARRVDSVVEVAVRDTGEGIPPDLLARIFEPHFSTRTSGTGIGLAIVRRMVESWGGEIDAESVPGEGTRMRIRMRAAGPR